MYSARAIRVYTYNGAYLEKEEHKKGSIELGKLADFVVIDRDIISTPVEEINNIKVLKTIFDGQIVFNYK